MASEEELKADAAAAEKYCFGGHVAIFNAARDGAVPALRHVLRVDPGRVHAKESSFGRTPLHVAACNGHVEAAKLLLSKGAAVDAKDDHGNTPLHDAAGNGKVAAAEFLLSKGAAVDAKNNQGGTPLHSAAYCGEVAAAEFLLSKGAAVDAKNNQGKTPLAVAREERETKMEQFLLNWSAKKPSADDGKAPVHSADKASEEVKKDAAHAAGSGAVAVKHQRESSKEAVVQAAKELQEAMDSGDAQVLKNAIDNAKLHEVSPEDVMKALEKYIALQEAANQSATSPVGKAAKELQVAMDSGDAQVLKNAIDNAKLHKVSQEDIMKALEKYIALQEAANQSATSPVKEATTSKAESSVKLEPGHGARLAMFSARFNEKNKETETKFRAVHQLLVENQYEVLMVEAGEGESFGDLTARYVGRLKREKGIMLAVCTSDYGEMTASPFCTYYELKSAVEYKIDVLPLQVEDEWQPNPPCGEGHLDKHKDALGYIDLVFTPSRVRLDCRGKSVEEIAGKIAAVLRKPL